MDHWYEHPLLYISSRDSISCVGKKQRLEKGKDNNKQRTYKTFRGLFYADPRAGGDGGR